MRRFVSLLTAVVAVIACTAASPLKTEKVYPEYRSLKISSPDNFYAPPIIRLGTSDRLVINFDCIGDDSEYLRCRLIHCNADWTPSPLLPSQYASGFNEMSIEDYAYSESTFIHYVNYRIELPSEELEPLVSGNYILEIFREEDPDDVIIRARFSVEDPQVDVSAKADAHTDIGINEEWQKVDVSVDMRKLGNVDPFNDMFITVEQNSTPATVTTLRHPSRIYDGHALYEHSRDLIFPAGNEFLRFETVRTDYPGIHIDSIRYVGPQYHAWLHPDKSRKYSEYQYDKTQAGRFIVREHNSTDSDLGADYVMVHLQLEMPELPGYDVYVDGEMTNGEFTEFNRMHYDIDKRSYTAAMPLKQGAYNYRYVAVDRADRRPDYYMIDGNSHETVNEYLVKVYVHDRINRTDRLVGHTQIKTYDR